MSSRNSLLLALLLAGCHQAAPSRPLVDFVIGGEDQDMLCAKVYVNGAFVSERCIVPEQLGWICKVKGPNE